MNVDVIMPTYNHKGYLEEAIQSVLGQSHKNVHLTVVDDCSDIDLSYLKDRYASVNFIRTPENLGPAGARNFGIANTTSEIISFLDDDDIMHRDKILLSVQEFKKRPEIGMTCGNYQIVVRSTIRAPFYRKRIDVNHNTLMKQNLVASGSVSIRRSVIEEIGGFNEKYWIGEDYDCWIRVSELYPISYIHKILYFYRIIPGGGSLTQRSDIQAKHLENILEIKKESKKRLNK